MCSIYEGGEKSVYMKVDVAYLRWRETQNEQDRMFRLTEVLAGLHVPVELYPSWYQVVDSFEADEFDLDTWWRKYNVVDGDERPVELGVRSMCVGDAFVINGQPHFCLSLGWSE